MSRPKLRRCAILAFAFLAPAVVGLDNGLALTPPMGWKSWNAYNGNINDTVIREAIDRVVARTRLVDGKPTSFKDLGFNRVGIDDGWQACGTGWKGSFHAQDGTPLLNRSRFPDLKGLVDYGHSKGLLMGWYNINCICMDTYTIQRDEDKDWARRVYKAEVELMLDAGFDSIKIDNCGDDMGEGYAMMLEHINVSGHPMLVENSNQGHGKGPPRGEPTDGHGWCGFNFFRTGGDIVSDFGVVLGKLQRTTAYQDLTAPISRPGCWAYPDMLEVGNFGGSADFVQSRTHFGAWCVVSSPLYLGFDLENSELIDSIWDIVSNREAIAINQAWAGHPGRLVQSHAAHQLWAKRMPGGGQAALVLNRGSAALPAMSVSLADLELNAGTTYVARDVWAHKDLPSIRDTWDIPSLAPFDSAFVRFTPTGPASESVLV